MRSPRSGTARVLGQCSGTLLRRRHSSPRDGEPGSIILSVYVIKRKKFRVLENKILWVEKRREGERERKRCTYI